MELDDLIIEVRDKNLQRRGVILSGDLELEVAPVHNNIGSWKITLPTEHPMCDELRTPGSGLIVTGPNDVILSGPTLSPEFSATPDDIEGVVTFTGVGDTIALGDALAWPQPSNDDASTQTLSHDERTGVAETLMHQFVNANIGPSAPASRRKAGLIMGTDYARGASLTKQARFPVLGELLNEIASTEDIGFRIVQRGQSLVFETYAILDRHLMVRLSLSNGELSGQKVVTAAPSVTRVIVAGSGQQVDRTFIERSNADSLAAEVEWGRRIEKFLDQRQTGVIAELQQAGDETLAEGGATIIGVQAVPTADSKMEYGKDWFLGDKVTVEIDGVESTMTALGLILKASDEGFRYGIQLGNEIAFTPDATRTLAGVEQRVSALERNDAEIDPLEGVWQTPTLTNSWTAFGGSFAPPRYMRKNGIVYLKGMIASGAIGSTAFTLPTGFRPAEDGLFSSINSAVTSNNASTGTAHTHNVVAIATRLRVNAAGTVVPETGANAYVSLSGISFVAEA